MINGRVFSLLKNVLLFFIGRLYREWEYILRTGQSYSEKASERGDLYVKQLIENIIHDRARKYDPYLVNRSAGISWGRTGLVLGKAEVTGLSTLHRTNLCALTEVGNRLFINTNLGAGPLSYRRQITFRFGNFERKAVTLISINNINVSVDFSVEKGTGRNGFLLDFTINELNEFKPSINGSGYFGWITNLFLSFWTLVLGRLIRNLLENELEQYILVRLPKYQFPVEGISYRGGSKFNIPHKDVQNNETSLSEAFCMKQNDEKPNWPRLCAIGKSSLFDRYNSGEYATEKDFGFNQQTTKTARGFLQTNKWTSEINGSYLPSPSLRSVSSSKNSCSEDSKGKAERKYDPYSLLSIENLEISRSLNRIKEDLDSISQAPNSLPQRITWIDHFKVLEDDEDDYSLFAWNIPGELNIDEIQSNSNESTDTETSSPAKGFENEQSFLMCERREKVEKESKMDDFSQILRDSCTDQVNDSADTEENIEQSKPLNEIFSKIREHSCRENANAKLLDVGTKLQINVANYNSLPSTKIESNSSIFSSISEVEPSTIETGTLFNPTLSFDSEMTKAQIVQDQKMFIEEVSDEIKETEDSNKNCVSVESCENCRSPESNFSALNLDLKLCSTGKFQNDFFNSYTVDELEKDLKAYFSGLRQKNETRIEDSESTKSYNIENLPGYEVAQTPEARYNSDPEDRVDSQTSLKSNKTFDSTKQMIRDEQNLVLETETESVTSIQFSEKRENETEKIPFKYVEVHIEELNNDSLLQADEDYTDNSSSSEELNISSELQNEDTVHNNLLEELVRVLSERGIECPDCISEFLSIANLKLNADFNKDGLVETPDPKALHHLLQQEIIAKIRELKSDVVLESDTEDSEYSGSSPISSCDNLGYETEELLYNEINLSLKDSKTNDSEITSLLKENCPSLSVTEHPILDSKTLLKFGFVSGSDAEITDS